MPRAPRKTSTKAKTAPRAPSAGREPGSRARRAGHDDEDERVASGDDDGSPSGADEREKRRGDEVRENAHRDDGDGDADPSDDVAEVDAEVVEATGEVVDDGDEAAIDDADVETGERRVKEGGALTRLDPLAQYLREASRHPLLTPEEEQTLARRYVETGDVEAAARLVTANLRLVVKIAYEYRRAYRNMMDLVQEGNIGLMQAVKRYDPYRGVKLSSYAAWWIRAYILRFILNNWRLVKLGTTQAQRKLFFNLNKEKARLSAMGIEPTAAEIATRLGVGENEVTEMDRRLSSGESSLDAPVGDSDGRSVSRIDLMPSAGAGPDAVFANEELQYMVKERLARFRETLQGKERQIFDERLVADEPLTLQELGDKFGISRERVRQLEARLTGRLRDYLRGELGDAVEVG